MRNRFTGGFLIHMRSFIDEISGAQLIAGLWEYETNELGSG
jgi:hypothetical protein